MKNNCLCENKVKLNEALISAICALQVPTPDDTQKAITLLRAEISTLGFGNSEK